MQLLHKHTVKPKHTHTEYTIHSILYNVIVFMMTLTHNQSSTTDSNL